MKLLEHEIQNFGPHQKRTFVFGNAPIIGVSGPNGSGKTNIIESFRFSFTGKLPEDLSTYVRNTPDVAKTNAVVTTKFSKHGVVGDIYRRFGVSKKHTLKWGEEEEIKSVAGTSAKLKEIFGADTEAIAAAVFIPQGDMDKILFGTPAEREELFVRLLLMSHMSRVEAMAEKRLGGLRAMVVDLGPMLDALRTALAEAERNFAERQATLGQKPDLSECQQAVKANLDAVVAWRGVCENLESAHNTWNSHVTNLQAAGFSAQTVDAAELQLANYEKEIERARTEGILAGNWLAARRAIGIEAGKVKQLNDKLEDVRLALAELPKVDLAKASAAWTAFDEVTSQSRTAKQQQVSWKKDYDKITENKAQCEKWTTEGAALNTELGEFHAKKQVIDMSLTVADAVQRLTKAKHAKHAGNKCPVCESAISADFLDRFTPEKIAELQKSSIDLDRKIKLTEQAVEKLRNAFALLRDQSTRAETGYTEITKTVTALEEKLQVTPQPEVDRETLAALLIKKPKLEQEDAALVAQISATEKNHAQLVEAASKLSDPGRYSGLEMGFLEKIVDEHQETAGTQTTLRDALRVQMRNCKDLIAAEREANGRYQNLVTLEATAQKKCEETRLARAAIFAKHAAGAIPLVPGQTDEVVYERALLQALEVRESERQQLIGAVREADRLVQNNKQQLAEMAAKDERQATIRQAMEDIDALRNTFMRKNLPKAYVERKFADLFRPTVELLQSLGADFDIEPSAEDPLSYTFTRAAHPEIGALPMKKLSGGEKVRLTLATLVALQQEVLPGIGLLVLDEPAVHLDEEGVFALRDTLEALQSVLRNNDMQIIICDHNKELETAYNFCIKL